jgi:ATP-dependent Lhr-like helicase
MRQGAIEETVIPRNPLDVLAQQIVAICADEEIDVGELHQLIRRAYPSAELSRVQLENVLDMLAGRYPSDEFAELRPRIVWDRTGGVVRGRQGARRLAVTNAGTIPDRGLFGVHLVDGGGRVGELDEEMVYEAAPDRRSCSAPRAGGSRRSRATACSSRLRPGFPGPFPSGRARASGVRTIWARQWELSRASWPPCPKKKRRRSSATSTPLTSAPRRTCSSSCESRPRTGRVPSDRTVVVERFRDEIGDWRSAS